MSDDGETLNSDSDGSGKCVENVEIISYPKKQSRGENSITVKSSMPYHREEILKWDGWGYKDSKFIVEKNSSWFTGDRYPVCHRDLKHFLVWVQERFGIFMIAERLRPSEMELPHPDEYPISKISDVQMRALSALGLKISTRGSDRLIRSHGQTLYEIEKMRTKNMDRIPDLVIWPKCHEDVVEIVKVCDKNNIVIIPYGGGTNVTGALDCPVEEERPILSLDTSMMNEILWVDKEGLMACCEGGIIGQDLERELRKIGYTMGHEPDSFEFSTLGGWVATRASGMKKNNYGNIEDLVVHAKMVTPMGILNKGSCVPRMSCGPDFDHIILGSEGCFGVITDVIIKIRPLPECKRYGSLVFPDLKSGVECLREISRQRCAPASIRLMDNEQFALGRSLRGNLSYVANFIENLKMLYLVKVRGFDLEQMAMATVLYEGDTDEVMAHERKINAIAAQYGGLVAGESNGERGYNMTFVAAYIRDVAFELNVMCESIETSIQWDKVMDLIDAVRARVARECKRYSLTRYSTMCRVAQIYDSGACVYFYFAFNAVNSSNAVKMTEHLEEMARDEIIAMGGSISHHHGVGKIRRKWYESSVSPIGQEIFKACKSQMDPNNIFAILNLTQNLKPAPCKL